ELSPALPRMGPARGRKGGGGATDGRRDVICSRVASPRSEADLVAALQLQHLAGVVRRGELEAEAFDDLPGPGDLLGIRFRQLAGADPQRVLQADADVAAHRR